MWRGNTPPPPHPPSPFTVSLDTASVLLNIHCQIMTYQYCNHSHSHKYSFTWVDPGPLSNVVVADNNHHATPRCFLHVSRECVCGGGVWTVEPTIAPYLLQQNLCCCWWSYGLNERQTVPYQTWGSNAAKPPPPSPHPAGLPNLGRGGSVNCYPPPPFFEWWRAKMLSSK